MRRAGFSSFRTVVILAMTAVFFGYADAAPKKESGDSAPVLLSTKTPKPKWKNVTELKEFAANGDAQACFELGDRYVEGDGVPQDPVQAIPFFERAAKGGLANAWFKLGKIYHDGLGVPVDYVQALDYFTRAARANVTEAQHNIGAMLVSARGVKRDYIEGLAWLIVAAKSGDQSDAEAQVRNRLTKRPPDLEAAETRAAELQKNLNTADVHATFLATTASSAMSSKVGAPVPPPVERPRLSAPKVDPVAPPTIAVPPPGKP